MSWRKMLCLLFLVPLGVGGAGCIGPGGIPGSVGYPPSSGRSCTDFPTNFRDSWYAVQQAMADLHLNVESEQNNGSSGTLTSRTQNAATITISIVTQPSPIPIDGLITRICVRVGTFGDQGTSDRILARIGERLAPHLSNRVAPATQTMAPSPRTETGWQKPPETSITPIVISPSVPGPQRRQGQ